MRISSRSLVEGDIGSRRWSGVQGARAYQAVIVLLLDYMRAPARDARADEDPRVEIAANAHQQVGHRRRAVHTLIKSLLPPHDAIHNCRHVIPTCLRAN